MKDPKLVLTVCCADGSVTAFRQLSGDYEFAVGFLVDMEVGGLSEVACVDSVRYSIAGDCYSVALDMHYDDHGEDSRVATAKALEDAGWTVL